MNDDDLTIAVQRAISESDSASGWRAYQPVEGGHMSDAHESVRRWLNVLHVTIVSGIPLVTFAWLEPGTPKLTHLTFGPQKNNVADTTISVRLAEYLFTLLKPGWRDLSPRVWIDGNTVLIEKPDRPTQPRADIREKLWRG